jgi:TPR repeat protein
MHDRGLGVPQDTKEARVLWEKGARLGYVPAMVHLGTQSINRVESMSRQERIERYSCRRLK